jgi:conjugative transfer region protein TrbK
MNMVRTGRALLSAAVVGVPLFIVCAGNERVDEMHRTLQRGRATVLDPFRDELNRCRDLGFEANADAACQALWARVRDRFLRYEGRANAMAASGSAALADHEGPTR